tara:strand:- start:693345 stop:693833 length:489 start_codon:yes stop_codon:yes gene_type:complete
MTANNVQGSVLDQSADHLIGTANDFLTIYIAGQMFGIPVLQVQDVLGDLQVSKIPLAPPEVDGSLNLRGRIVTAINVRRCLGLENRQSEKAMMSVVVEHEEELYSLSIDDVGDVLGLLSEDYEASPATLDPKWRDVSQGIYRLDGKLLIVLDVPKLINDLRV